MDGEASASVCVSPRSLRERVMRKGTHPGLRPPLPGGDVCCSPLGRGAALAAGWVIPGPVAPHVWRALVPGNGQHTSGSESCHEEEAWNSGLPIRPGLMPGKTWSEPKNSASAMPGSMDSQMLYSDVYACLALAARAYQNDQTRNRRCDSQQPARPGYGALDCHH